MRKFNLILFFSFCFVVAKTQCLTNFSKLTPEKVPNFAESFGMDVDVYDDIMAIGAPTSDSLGLASSGIVYLYKKNAGNWQKIGALAPSVPIAQSRFGNKVVISENYILVSGSVANGGVYIFKKQPGGWQGGTELLLLKPTAGINFGSSFDISEDEQTIVVSDIGYSQSAGAFFVFHKNAIDEWSGNIVPQIVVSPDKNQGVFYFGIGGVQILGNKIACSTMAGFGAPIGTVYIFSDNSGQFTNLTLEARLTENSGGSGGYGPSFMLTESGIFKYRLGKFEFYQLPASGTWLSSGPTCEFSVSTIDNLLIIAFQTNFTFSGNSIYFTAHLNDKTGRLVKISKLGSDWCGPLTEEVLHEEPQLNGSSLFVRSLAAYDEREVALSWVNSVSSRTAVAIGAFTKQLSGTWSKQPIVKSRLEANNFQFGRTIWNTEKFLFSSAVNERVSDRDPRGAVYVFEKQDDDWIKVNKLFEEPMESDDFGYGSDVVSYGDQIAIAAYGYGANGLLFIYQGEGEDLSSPRLIQKIEIPTGKVIDRFGNLAMSQNFLIIPAATITNPSTENILMVYKKGADHQWKLDSELSLGPVNPFIKRAATIDLKGNTLISSNGFNQVFIFEYNEVTNVWENKHTLTASDPDRDPIFPNFPAVIDGSLFGAALKLDKDKIFVGAPGKNNGSLNDVGAIYVYTKQNGVWNSGTEARKILPDVKQANLLFGFSLDVLENTLITGAPSTNQPGKVYVLQSKDYYWRNSIQLLFLEGNTFQLDYYGYSVKLSRDDFFITAPLENNSAGLSAGAVYNTLPPPIIVLAPPVCSNEGPIDLFGYPFDGRWSGPGIIDEVSGLFDPTEVLPGVYELTYRTSKCFYEGKLQIEVKAFPSVEDAGSSLNKICLQGKTEVLLSVAEESGVSYTWYYRKDAISDFEILPIQDNEVNVTTEKLGDYRLELDKSSCKIFLNYKVELENVDIELTEVDVICDSKVSQVKLEANIDGGIWKMIAVHSSLIDQSTKTISISTLDNGQYPLQYVYESPIGCIYSEEIILDIQKMRNPEVNLTGEICSNENQTLKLNNRQVGTDYQWYYLPDINADSVFLSTSSSVLSIEDKGYYGVITTRATCRQVFDTQYIAVKEPDTIFVPNVFTPNNDLLNDRFKVVSNFDYVMLAIYNRWGKLIYNGDGKVGWDGEDAATGVYYWTVFAKNCLGETVDYKGWVHLTK